MCNIEVYKVPHIDKAIRRQPLNTVRLGRVIVIHAVAPRIEGEYKLRGDVPQSQGAILFKVISLPIREIGRRMIFVIRAHKHDIANATSGVSLHTYRIQAVSIDKKCRINSYPYPIRCRNDPYLDRVQLNVATLEGEKQEEANGEDREQWEMDLHRAPPWC